RAAALRTGPVLIACALLLVGSGLIEGFISPDPRFSFASRVVVGVGYWCLMVAFLSGRLFRRRTPAEVRAAR
ncbi:MAG: hypothetical protein JOY74_03840, partial [Sinobacteraceae bacterium]|nr:hypothetical protein [Nevskiaceae bacterium]